MSNHWRETAFEKVFPPGAQRLMEYNYHGNYEGSGFAIALVDGQFAVADYSHCSCRGPDESMSGYTLHGTLLDAVRAAGQSDMKRLLKALYAEASGSDSDW